MKKLRSLIAALAFAGALGLAALTPADGHFQDRSPNR